MSEQPGVDGSPPWAKSRLKRWLVLGGFTALPVYLVLASLFFVLYDGSSFVTPVAYGCGLLFAAALSVLAIRVMPGSSENVLLAMLVVFPILLMITFPVFALAPLRVLHTFLPQQESVEILHFEHPARCGGRRSSFRGAKLEEAFGVFNNHACKLPVGLVGQLRSGDEMHWLIKRSAVGFSLERLERVTRNRKAVLEAPW